MPMWVDNTSAIQISKSDIVRPKSRHYALRYLRVKDECERIAFCPTDLMKADPLTKVKIDPRQRKLLFHHTYGAPKPTKDSDKVNDDDEALTVLCIAGFWKSGTACDSSFLAKF